ncbi:hypothetical protein HO133_004981 [Letharia lupina]|uniref:Uncharacterized protein n=1 Tax=Letharia lupina TaxID=560253 RepID=A0A8H6F8R1_9LECA|nr:uncharacterized protein HO133_004981 [Letharia lupina]KAF6219156.1 hypothetical protein HO133_004981 [Letharia lupina]
MRVTKSVVFGLVSLVCTINAIEATGKPVLAKRQAVVTVTNDGCTAICWDLSSSDLGTGTDCDVYCSEGFSTTMPATSTSTSVVISTVTSSSKTALNQPTVVSSTGGDCSAVCTGNLDEGDIDCGFDCGGSFYTAMPTTSTSKSIPTSEVALNRRTVISATSGDCTAICWDLMPGTECDVQCKSDFRTEMPVPSKAARVGLEARENVQAHQVREARLARKFGGLVGRDDSMTVTVTSIPEYCTAGPESSISTTVAGIPTILPMQVPQAAGAFDTSAALSQASAAISAVQQVMPSAASSALSQASAALSSMTAAAPISANATIATPASTGSAPTVSATTTATSTSSETGTPSTTTTGSLVVSEVGSTTRTIVPANGALPEYTVPTGLVLSLLVALAANVAFLI